MDKKTETKKIWELYDEISHDVTQSGEAWCNYLDFASRIYKYKFDNALLIYAQNPDATMVAEKTTWEGKVGRKVNKDATAIAVFDVMSAKPELRTLFDVSQTSGADKTIPNLWRLTEGNAAPLLARLKETHNYDADTMEQYISFEALRRINEIRPGFYEGIKRNTIGSPLAECESGEELKSQVDIMIWQSAMYLMYKRCGFDTRDLTPHMERITEYNNKSLLYRMGNCATIIAQDFLSECATTLNQLVRENREKAIQEKAHILATPPPPSKDVKRSVSANIMAQANVQLSMFDEPETEQEADRINEILEKAIHEVALSGGVTQGGTDRIYDFFSKENKTTERVNFLKNEYGICGSGLKIEGVSYISWSADGKGVDISFELDDKDYKEHIKWTAMAKETQKCIDNGEYPIPENADEEATGIPFKYGDIISYKGATYEVLDSTPDEQTTDIGNLDYHVNGHTYIIVEVEPWEDLKNAELIRSGENIIDAENKAVENIEADETEILEVNKPLEYNNRKYKITRIDEEHVHMLDITYDGIRHPQLFTSKSDFIEAPIDDVREALADTDWNRTYSLNDFLNAELEIFPKDFGGRTFNIIYAAINSDRYLLSFEAREDWSDELLLKGRKTAYRDYLMERHGYTHKEAMIEAELVAEDEYDSYYEEGLKLESGDEFNLYDRRYAVLNFDENKQEVLVRDITRPDEENLPLYYVMDIPFVYARTQGKWDLPNMNLEDFLNGDVSFTDVTFGEGDEASVYTYGELKVNGAVFPMDYTVDSEWTDADIDNGKRRAYREYLIEVMKYSEKDACIAAGILSEDEYDELTSKFTPVDTIPMADEVINAPIEETEQEYKTEELAYEKPEIIVIVPDGPRADYVYSPDDGIGDGGPKQKFRANIEAIETLNKIEAEHRRATADEQKILCKYVGWGGLAEAFDPSNEAWKNEYVKLKELLTDEEYKSARTSVLTAHYTPPEVIQEMYDTISRFGFKGGNILDPSMGTGLFFAAMPEEIRNNSNLYGYEIDDVSGRIAKQLHQNANIKIQGFETNEEPDNFYDVVISNIPFGEHRLYDPKLNKYKFAIHDYFMAKALDKVRPGGIVAFVASKWVMDKSNPAARKYLAEKADLVGSVRLPDKTFRQMANTRVTTDIIFLQKRERIVSNEPYWVNLGEDSQGIPVNAYYKENPDMMLGKMEYGTRYGENSTTDLIAFDDFDLKRDLHSALSNLNAEMTEYIGQDEDEKTETIPADPSVKNFTYTFVDDSLYYRENSTMRKMDYQGKPLERITGMHEIRKITRDLIEAQATNMPGYEIKELQKQLNEKYDAFVKKNGYISETANERVFRDDSDYPLICSLEKYNSDLKIYEKADMFSKRTIRPNIKITSVDNAVDALRVSLSEKGRVDFPFMSNLYRNTRYVDMYEELNGLVFINPEKVQGELPPHMSIEEFFDEMGNQNCIETADEYLSGNVRHKFHIAEAFTEDNPELFAKNRQKLESVLPELLTAAEIDVSLGITWIDTDDYNQFMYETFNTPYYLQNNSRNPIKIEYNPIMNSFSIRNKGQDNYSVTVTESFGTKRKTAYEILEESLNMRSVTVRDPYEDENGKIKYKDNVKETMLARAKQDLIKSTFREWIFEDAQRRKKYVDYYNETFNNMRLRKYDGSFLTLQGMSQELELRDYQKNAVARGLLSNTGVLLDHKVGAGKSFVMAAICMEQRRLGNLQKAIFVVPNHLTGQMGSEFLRLYPSAKILVTTKRDFEKQNRLKFISKIATGDWDAVIIGHSQFEKIAMSKERQILTLQKQVDEIIGAVSVMREEQGENFTIKQMEKMKESLTTQIKELTDDTAKDDLITFESLGIDYMFVDEAHYYKNCAVFSKMNNVAGISQTRAKKSTDMLMKCKYMQEINDGKGVVFATGTPISNSMTEMFVMQRYLDPRELDKRDMQHFDAWAAQYGEVVTALELAPEGTGYRYRTRFAKFKNLPELLSMYHNFADVVTDEQLNLDIPKIRDGQSTIVACQPSDYVVLKMMEFVDRADAIHAGLVKSWQDNMLKITNEARLLATDSRLIDPTQDIDDNSKIRRCAENIYTNYIDSEDIKGTQIAFCDIGTPKGEGIFDVYHALKDELIKKGIPEDEISFIHEAKTDTQKEALFEKMRSGEKRIIIGSTNKLGVGTNIQDRVVAMHHIDCPWRPSDIEQRDGRGLRHGNINDEVGVYRYVTQNTFDSYLWQLVENKQRFISQIKSGKMVGRTCEDIDEAVLSYAEVKAVATGDERIKEKMDIDLEVSRLQMLKANYDNQRYTLQDKFTFQYPKAIAEGEKRLDGLIKDKATRDSNQSEEFMMVINGRTYTERDEAGKRLMLVEHSLPTSDNDVAVGTYSGFELKIRKQAFMNGKAVKYVLSGERDYSIEPSDSPHGNTMRLDNALKGIEDLINKTQIDLEDDKRNLELAKVEYEKPFAYGDELEQKLKRQAELNKELNLDKGDDVIADEDENDMRSEEAVTDKNSQKKAAVDTIPYSQNEKMNYLLLNTMFPDIIQGRSDYMKFKAEHYDDMYVEKIGSNTYALCLFYIQNGDVMREPEYTFRIDRENKAARILEWTMSSMGIYQCVYSDAEPEKCNRGLKQDLDSTFNQTLKDIKNIDYTPYMSDEESDEYDVEM